MGVNPSKGVLLRIPRSFLESGFFASSSVIFAGSFVVNALNYAFTLIISRMLDVEAFGEVTALFSLMLIVSVPATALAMLMTREAAFRGAEGPGAVRALFVHLRKNALAASLALWAAFACLVPAIAGFLRLEVIPLLAFSLLIPVALASSLQSGTLQGLQEFFLLAKQNALSAAVKLAVSIALVYAGFSVTGVMLGLVAASLASWGYGYLATRRIFVRHAAPQGEEFALAPLKALFMTILATTLLMALLSNIDVLLAKHFLSAEAAGQYGALSTIGKILVYGVGAFITVLLPLASAAEAGKSGGGRRILGLSLAIILAASVAAFGLFSLVPGLIITALFGARYLAVAPHLGLFAAAMGCISLSTAFINYFVAARNTSFLYFLAAGIAAEVALISANHASLGAVTGMLAASSALLLALMAANYALLRRTVPAPALP
jgi:O-antigen/teichoic acid export membrane protein